MLTTGNTNCKNVHCAHYSLFQNWLFLKITTLWLNKTAATASVNKNKINSSKLFLTACNQNSYKMASTETLISPSSPADAIHLPSGLNRRKLTQFVWP